MATIYHVVTGACETGCRLFMEGKGKLKDKYTLAEILKETDGAYEYQRFKSVVTGGEKK